MGSGLPCVQCFPRGQRQRSRPKRFVNEAGRFWRVERRCRSVQSVATCEQDPHLRLLRPQPGKVGGALSGQLNLLESCVGFRRERSMFEQQPDSTADDRKEVVEIVRDSSGQLADGFHLLGLAKLFRDRLPLGTEPLFLVVKNNQGRLRR